MSKVVRVEMVLERSILRRLHLVDEDITGSVTHLHALVVVHDSVVGIRRRVNERRLGGLLADHEHIGARRRAATTGGGRTREDHNKLLPAAERVVDLDVVERQGQPSGERHRCPHRTRTEGSR